MFVLLPSPLSEFKDPLERLVPIGAILEGGRAGLLDFKGELSGLETVVLVLV